MTQAVEVMFSNGIATNSPQKAINEIIPDILVNRGDITREAYDSGDQVVVARYYRPRSPTTFQRASWAGVTVIFVLDYTGDQPSTVHAYVSLCKGDNFNKVQGLKHAIDGSYKLTFDENLRLDRPLAVRLLDHLPERSGNPFWAVVADIVRNSEYWRELFGVIHKHVGGDRDAA